MIYFELHFLLIYITYFLTSIFIQTWSVIDDIHVFTFPKYLLNSQRTNKIERDERINANVQWLSITEDFVLVILL